MDASRFDPRHADYSYCGPHAAEKPYSPRRWKLWQQALALVGMALVLFIFWHLMFQTPGPTGPGGGGGPSAGQLQQCPGTTPCPVPWTSSGGGYFCGSTGGCRAGDQGPFDACPEQCLVGDPPIKELPSVGVIAPPSPPSGGGAGAGGATVRPGALTKPGTFDLRVMKDNALRGCAAPIGRFPGHPKYGCSGNYSTAVTCDAARYPVKDTKYVKAVHDGCETAQGRGTYGYAYDDGVGLKQCSPLTRYEWVLCPTGSEGPVYWKAVQGQVEDSTRRFRVTNKCNEPIWVQQAGDAEQVLPDEQAVRKIEAGASHTYSIPNRGLPSTRFLPKTGCDTSGNNCDIQSMPPCPPQGCDMPIDTKFESSWGCTYARGTAEDKENCALTGQGNPSTFQDWWDGSAVDGWTLPFSVLVADGGHGLTPGSQSDGKSCGDVVCAKLVAADLCPRAEYLTPVS